MLANSSNPVHKLRPGQDLPHLAGAGALPPQIFATRFARQCPDILEIRSRKRLFSLIDNAKAVVIEYPPAPERVGRQVPQVVSRPHSSIRTTVDLKLHDHEFAGTSYSGRRVFVLDPVARS
jgi:hypothetical protein